MRRKIVSLVVLFLAILLLGVVAIADRYPQGEAYKAGGWWSDTLGREFPEYEQMPSPASNPTWVRFFQDKDDLLIVIGLVGLFISFTSWPHKYRIQKVS